MKAKYLSMLPREYVRRAALRAIIFWGIAGEVVILLVILLVNYHATKGVTSKENEIRSSIEGAIRMYEESQPVREAVIRHNEAAATLQELCGEAAENGALSLKLLLFPDISSIAGVAVQEIAYTESALTVRGVANRLSNVNALEYSLSQSLRTKARASIVGPAEGYDGEQVIKFEITAGAE